MRSFRQFIGVAAIGAGVFLLAAGTSNAQVLVTTGVNPYTGQVYSYSAGYNGLTNQYGASNLVINPVTGQQVVVGVGQNPITGTIYSTDAVRNPWTGATLIYRQRYNPYVNSYRWRANYRRW
jgi:hypothetical protein